MGNLLRGTSANTKTIYFGRQNNPNTNNNKVETTKYSLITFLPKALILQFIRPANYVYLITAIAQSIKQISSLSPITAIAPLIFVLGVALIKEGIQDYKRHKKDNETNNQITRRLVNEQFIECKWQQVCIGDYVMVKEDEFIPADIVLLFSTEQNSICYVQTANLDGENNLKTKVAFVDQIKLYPNSFQQLKGTITVQKPNSNLHQFNAKIQIQDCKQKPLSMENLLVRGSILKNTTEAVGVVVYSGQDTKIMKNTGQVTNKVSHVQRKVNKIQLFLLFLLIILSMVCALGYYRYHTQYPQGNRSDFFYLRGKNQYNMHYETLLVFFTSFLLLSFIIPVSMNVALEGIKIFLGIFVGFDKKMYYQPLKQYCSTLNMSIIQQLGSIDYVLTDKTGTLTANEMKFRFAWINGFKYSTLQLKKNYEETFNNNYRLNSSATDKQSSINILKLSSCLKQFNAKINSTKELSQYQSEINQKKQFDEFWKAVILCHQVVVDVKKNQFQGSSPDEVCFVEFAEKIGFKFIKRTKNSIQINVKGEKIIYELLYMLPFTSRKRMSVIVRDLMTKKIIMYSKGADSAIIQKSIPYSKRQSLQENLTQFSVEGLRTLVFAKRVIGEEQYLNMMKSILDIQNSKLSGNVQSPILQSQTKDLTEKTQSNLQIIGSTAIQDRLQDDVPQTIARLQLAGIVVMMITGDKLETAENIGRLSNFIHKDASVFRIRSNVTNILDTIKQTLAEVKKQNIQQFSVIIEAQSINKYVSMSEPQPIELLRLCKSVIFCRSTPKQKASIVRYVKQKLKGIVLAIGDGGNDVGMIQQADIGVGLIGKQGNQAASSSDFYFSQFKFLDRLIIHHGRWIYYRISYFFVYYGSKNLALTLLMFYFMTYSAYSGFPAMSQTFITVYNSVIALLLVSYYSIWEQDINSDTFQACYQHEPIFYKQLKKLNLFSYKRYILWSAMATALSILLHFSFLYSLGGTFVVDSSGHPGEYSTYASGVAISLATSVILIIISDINNINWFSGVVMIGIMTILTAVTFFILENYFVFTNVSIAYALTNNFNLRYWGTIWLVISLTILVKYGWNSLMFIFWPTEAEKFMYKRQKVKQNNQFKSSTVTEIRMKQKHQI